MGLCFSKKQHARRRDEEPSSDARRAAARKAARNTAIVSEAKKAPAKKAVAKPEEPAADKRTVFVVKAAAAAAAAEVAATSNAEEVKRAAPEENAKPVATVGRTPVRTSSCTKEEVDAILIQCGRLSRSSSASGKAPSGDRRRYAGSKRSYDFDHDRRGVGGDDCDWGREGGAAAASRPSPRRRTPERKRSASHDGRTGAGSGSRSRRVSRSPGRRAEGALAAGISGAAERAARQQQQQPGKMVSVPARDKGRAPSPVKAASSGKRYPSPRSNSPARAAGNENAGAQPAAHGPVLSRSSSRKAEQSPFRRNPMAELDENALGNNQTNGNMGKPQKKSTESTIALPEKAAERPKDPLPSSRASKEKTEIVEEAVASDTKAAPSTKMNATHSVSIVAESAAANPRTGPGSRSSRRSSRDFDHNGSNSYASLLLEDIQNYHQQNTSSTAAAPSFSLPACVSKACSILEAVADLNSSSSENKSFEPNRSVNDKESVNGRYGGTSGRVVESEVVVKDDLMEPSLHKYVSVRGGGEVEPQESAGSNSFVGNAWTCSWEPNSVDSTDRTRSVSQSTFNGEEVEQRTEESWQSKQKLSSSQEPGRRGSSTGNVQVQRGRLAHRGGGVSASSSVV
ncbi:hypothetical protein QOZ80_4AG0309770 [Eleusine coracana subsp. coracana]|nr:hypothetical protein QOZ80_4AG0309770 [Eleusine coracana subsp. coracana]